MIFGTTKIDGRYWLVMLPLGGRHRTDGPTSQFGKMIELSGKGDFHTEMGSICEEQAREECMVDEGECWTAFGRVVRYDEQPCNWKLVRDRHAALDVGFRPVIVPLKSAAGVVDDYYMSTFKDGGIIEMGTLVMNGEALKNPQNPVYCHEDKPSWCPPKNGDCPRYVEGAKLLISNTSPNIDERIRFIKTGNCFVADRVILGAVSYDDLLSNLHLRKYRGNKLLVAGYYEPRKDAWTMGKGTNGKLF